MKTRIAIWNNATVGLVFFYDVGCHGIQQIQCISLAHRGRPVFSLRERRIPKFDRKGRQFLLVFIA